MAEARTVLGNEPAEISFEIPGVLWRRDPQTRELPLVFDSPHSGSSYPEDFQFCCPFDVLAHRRGYLCRRTLWRRPGTRRDPDRGGVSTQLSRSKPGGRRSRFRADRRDLAGPFPLRTGRDPALAWYAGWPGLASRSTTGSSASTRSCPPRPVHAPYHRMLDEACEPPTASLGCLACQLPFDAVPAQRVRKAATAPISCWATETERPVSRNSPSLSPGCCAAAVIPCASTRSTRVSRS